MGCEQIKENEHQCVKNSSRRRFLIGSGTAVALGAIPGVSHALYANEKKYPRKKIARLSELKNDEQVAFRYPFDDLHSTNFLVKLGEVAGGGIGVDNDIVAFNGLCPHMGGPLSGIYNAEHKVAGPCPLHLTTFDLSRHGMVISGHATESLPQITLEVDGDDIYATAVIGLIYGHCNHIQEG